MSKNKGENGAALIAVSGAFYGLITVGGSLLSKDGGYTTFDISFFFMIFSVLVLAPFAIRKDRKILGKMKANWRFLSGYAFVNLFLLLTQFGSLSLGLSPPTVAFLIYTQPVWTIILGRIFFRERVGARGLGIIALALLGVLFITDPLSFRSSQNIDTILAEVLAIAGGFALSVWIILGKKGRLDQLKEPLSLTFAVRTFSILPIGLVSLGAYFIEPRSFLGPQDYTINIVFLALFAVFAGALPDYLFYRGVKNVTATSAGVILLLEPVSSAILSVALRIALLSWLQVVGGVLILISNYFFVLESKKGATEKVET